jgi:mono/diheme cytochrome c family protein
MSARYHRLLRRLAPLLTILLPLLILLGLRPLLRPRAEPAASLPPVEAVEATLQVISHRTRELLLGLGVVVVLVAAGLAARQWSSQREATAVARALTGGDPERAAVLVTRYGCGGCHAIPGLPGADGRVAQPLAGLRERVFIGGQLRNTTDNLIRWIVDPRAISPNSAMPATGISAAEARDVAAYLYAH